MDAQYPGAGLGLSVAKLIAEMHGGRIRINPEREEVPERWNGGAVYRAARFGFAFILISPSLVLLSPKLSLFVAIIVLLPSGIDYPRQKASPGVELDPVRPNAGRVSGVGVTKCADVMKHHAKRATKKGK